MFEDEYIIEARGEVNASIKTTCFGFWNSIFNLRRDTAHCNSVILRTTLERGCGSIFAFDSKTGWIYSNSKIDDEHG